MNHVAISFVALEFTANVNGNGTLRLLTPIRIPILGLKKWDPGQHQ